MKDDYSVIPHLFLELKGKGLSVSHVDLECLLEWKKCGLPVQLIVETLYAIADECTEKKTVFPGSLRSIDARVKKMLADALD